MGDDVNEWSDLEQREIHKATRLMQSHGWPLERLTQGRDIDGRCWFLAADDVVVFRTYTVAYEPTGKGYAEGRWVPTAFTFVDGNGRLLRAVVP